ncbi:MAG: hypothetical protein ACTSX1_02860 [Candidatus Heimdallarchaeaceae archaeon]
MEIGRMAFNPVFCRSMKKNAKRSQKREYHANFVYTDEKSNKDSYYMKLIYSECAVCKFHKQKMQKRFFYIVIL